MAHTCDTDQLPDSAASGTESATCLDRRWEPAVRAKQSPSSADLVSGSSGSASSASPSLVTEGDIAMPVQESPSMRELRAFVDRCHAAITKQSQGHPEPFLELWSHADDVTIMAA